MHVTEQKIAAAEVLGYMACANGVSIDVCKRIEGQQEELVTAFWRGWNARFDEE